jgi:peptide/nickel transport system permease protein
VSFAAAANPLGEGATPATAPSLTRQLLRRPLLLTCVIYIGLVIGVAIFAPIFMPWVLHQQAGNLAETLQGPSLSHPLGTDSLGRDVLEQLLVGTRVTMAGVLECCVVALAIGVPMGLIAGYAGGWIDRTVGWVTDLTFSMPAIAIILVVLSVFGQNELAGMVTLGVLSAPWIARVVRAVTLPVKEEAYIAAAHVSGLSRSYIVARHVFPRVLGAVIVQTSLLAAAALLAQTGLAYLGLIVTLPAPSWGGMVADGISNLLQQPWLIWPPGFAMVATAVAFGLLGDTVRDVNA